MKQIETSTETIELSYKATCITVLICSLNLLANIHRVTVTGECQHLMHQSFVSLAPIGPGNSRAFNFSIFKALVKAWHGGIRIPAKSLDSPETENNVEQQLGVVLMKLKYERVLN